MWNNFSSSANFVQHKSSRKFAIVHESSGYKNTFVATVYFVSMVKRVFVDGILLLFANTGSYTLIIIQYASTCKVLICCKVWILITVWELSNIISYPVINQICYSIKISGAQNVTLFST